jgi:AcrR family transcriptional regulator
MTLDHPDENQTDSRLARIDWINAAIKILSNQGVDAIKVGAIAKQLKITRGSFYWHFNKRQDLLDAVLNHWESVSTLNVIEQLEDSANSPRQRMHKLLTLAFSVDVTQFSFERAIRAWAVKDENVRQKLIQVDCKRLAYLQNLFQQLGCKQEEAEHHAQYTYYCRTGLYHQGQVPQLKQRLQMVDYLDQMLDRLIQ